MSKSRQVATESQPLVSKSDEEDPARLSNESHVNTDLPTIAEDAWDIIKLSAPIFVSRLSFVGMKTTDTALLGHVSREALSASALSDLWTMCSQVLLNGRILGVLVGGAVGSGNPKLAGIYLQISYLVLACMSVVVFIAWNVTEQVWLAFGSDPEISHMAGYYARVLSFAIPGILGFAQLSQFFSAQRIMHPEVTSASVGLVLNLTFGFIFVLGWPIPGFSGFRFEACPIVTTVVTYLTLGTLCYVYVHRQQLHTPAWGGWDVQELTRERIRIFCELYFPAALASASDFWRVAVIGTMAANLGEEEVAVFNTSYRIMWIALVMVGSLAGASSINMSIRLGKMDPYGARQAGHVGIAMAASILLILCMGILAKSQWFGRIFTNDDVFLKLFDDASLPFTLTLGFMNLAVAIERIPYAMGRTREIFWMGFVASWGGQVPGVYLMTTYWRADLIGLYTGMAIGYGLLCILYGVIVIQSDWVKYAELAQTRSESKSTPNNKVVPK